MSCHTVDVWQCRSSEEHKTWTKPFLGCRNLESRHDFFFSIRCFEPGFSGNYPIFGTFHWTPCSADASSEVFWVRSLLCVLCASDIQAQSPGDGSKWLEIGRLGSQHRSDQTSGPLTVCLTDRVGFPIRGCYLLLPTCYISLLVCLDDLGWTQKSCGDLDLADAQAKVCGHP